MRSLVLGALVAAGILLGLPDEAYAGGRSHGFAHSGSGHVHRGFHGGVRARIFFSAPLVVAPIAAYPYYYAPAPVYYAPPPPAYVEAPPQQYWYYCASARAYYPYVQDCPGGWQRVVPTPG